MLRLALLVLASSLTAISLEREVLASFACKGHKNKLVLQTNRVEGAP